MRPKLPPETKIFLKFYAFNVVMFQIFRIFFIKTHWPDVADESLSQIVWTILVGFRFDASIISFVFVSLYVLLFVPYLRSTRAWKSFWATSASIATALFFLLQVADVIYYETQQRKLGYEVFAYLNAGFLSIFRTALQDFPILVIASLLAVLISAYLIIRFFKKSAYLNSTACSPKTAALSLVGAAPFLVLTIRGGFQRVPLRIGDQMISKNQTINAAVASSPFLAIQSYLDRNAQFVDIIDSNIAINETKRLLAIDESQLIDPAYPIFRKRRECGSGTKPPYNVVVMLLESWTGKYVGPLGDTLNVTPEFNKIAKDGLFFDRFFAQGYRTTSGFFTTLTSIPDQTDRSVLRRLESQDRFGSFSTMLKARGYELLFVHGGLLDFDNMQSFLKKESFDTIIGKQHLVKSGGTERAWGFDDQFTLRRANEEFSKAKQPFFGLTLTVSTHVPYSIPDEAEQIYTPEKTPDWKFLNAYRYADWSLGDFFRLAKQSQYFKNTIFILVADHTHHQFISNKYDDQHIPLLIYAPGIVKSGVRHTIGSHSDLLPTVAGLLDLPYLASMGRDLLITPEDQGFAFWIDGWRIGWIDENYLAYMNQHRKKLEIYDHKKRDFKTDLAANNINLSNEIYTKLASWFQTSFDLVKNNKVLPKKFDLSQCQ